MPSKARVERVGTDHGGNGRALRKTPSGATQPGGDKQRASKRPSKRRAASIEDDAVAPPFRLRVAPGTIAGPDSLGEAVSTPSPACSRAVFSVDRAGHWEQRIWTKPQWDALPLEEHPPLAEVYCLIGGGYCHFREIASSAALPLPTRPDRLPDPAGTHHRVGGN
jgi:hypothetical protein